MSKLVLSVDDEAAVLYTREHLLQAEGYSVLSASGGKQALELFTTHSRIQLVLLDYAMPDLNGLTVAREMKHLRPYVPIVMVTGEQGALASSAASCVNEVLAKGMGAHQLLSKVREFIRWSD
jgi:CheY-like chemotaxis protein